MRERKKRDMYKTADGITYLTKGEARTYVGNRSDAWLDARVHNGLLEARTLPGNSRYKYYKKSELDALLTPKPVHDTHIPEDADFLTIQQFASKLQVQASYIHRLVKTGKIAAINVSGEERQGAIWRIPREEYERFVREREKA